MARLSFTATAACLLFATMAMAAPVPPARPDPSARSDPSARPAGAASPAQAEGPSARETPAPPEVPAALLRGLDKFSGVSEEFFAPIGGETAYGRLTIAVRACHGGGLEGDVAYLTITDAKAPETPAFEGWMFADSPALSALDHPRYDVWLAQCRTESDGAL